MAGTSTKNGTFNSISGSVANANPMVLDSAGRFQTEVWIPTSVAYKIVLANSTDSDPPLSPIWTEDNITGINDNTLVIDEWSFGFSGTFVSASSFTVAGDQTSILQVGRAVKILDAGGTKYGFIKTSVFGAVTTVTLDQNSDALASPVSSVYYAVVSATDPGLPILSDDMPLRGDPTDRSKQASINVSEVPTASTVDVTWPRVAGRMAIAPNLTKVISGFTYANNAGDPTNDLDVFSGTCVDSTGVYWIGPLSLSFFTKQSDVAWAVGNAAGGLDTGAVGNNDYYIWAIARSDTGVTDILYSLSSTAPTMPANYNFKRLIGWFKRVGGAIVAFHTYETAGGGLEMMWDAPTLDINLANTLTTARRTDAVKVPLTFTTTAHLNVVIGDAGAGQSAWICCPDQTDAAPSGTAAPLTNMVTGTVINGAAQMKIRTSSAGLIAARSTLATVDLYAVSTMGFEWARRN